MTSQLNIVLNGKPHTAADSSLFELLRKIGLEKAAIAVAINGKHVRRSSWESHLVREGDAIDILSPMAGG